MGKYKITVSGCDDETSIEMEMNDAESAFMNAVATRITEASTCVCQPRMTVEEVEAPHAR